MYIKLWKVEEWTTEESAIVNFFDDKENAQDYCKKSKHFSVLKYAGIFKEKGQKT